MVFVEYHSFMFMTVYNVNKIYIYSAGIYKSQPYHTNFEENVYNGQNNNYITSRTSSTDIQ
jgi:hypothetical protein